MTRKQLGWSCCALGALALASCGNLDDLPPDEGGAVERISPQALTQQGDLLYHWAPIHYQDVNKGGSNSIGGKADYITRFDLDNDWVAFNNWDSLPRGGNLQAYVYTDVVDSPTHWFLSYMFYHPRDWAASCCDDEHENDMEGILVIVRKDGTPYGRVEAALTQAHGPLGAYSNDSRVRGVSGNEWMQFEARAGESWGRPRTYQEAEGHGMYMCGHSGTKCHLTNEDGIKYLPLPFGVNPGIPGTVGVWTPVNYSFLFLDELWSKHNRGTSGYDAAGKPWQSWMIFKDDNGLSFRGDKSDNCGGAWLNACHTDAADAPWTWDGGGLKDPAGYYARRYTFSGLAGPSAAYLKNRYLGCADMTVPQAAATVRTASCNVACRDQIYAVDPYCRDVAWDGLCASRIESTCGIQVAR